METQNEKRWRVWVEQQPIADTGDYYTEITIREYPSNKVIAIIPGEDDGDIDNALLMAASPTMHDALDGILCDNSPTVSLTNQRARWGDRMEAAKQAIAMTQRVDIITEESHPELHKLTMEALADIEAGRTVPWE